MRTPQLHIFHVGFNSMYVPFSHYVFTIVKSSTDLHVIPFNSVDSNERMKLDFDFSFEQHLYIIGYCETVSICYCCCCCFCLRLCIYLYLNRKRYEDDRFLISDTQMTVSRIHCMYYP